MMGVIDGCGVGGGSVFVVMVLVLFVVISLVSGVLMFIVVLGLMSNCFIMLFCYVLMLMVDFVVLMMVIICLWCILFFGVISYFSSVFDFMLVLSDGIVNWVVMGCLLFYVWL